MKVVAFLPAKGSSERVDSKNVKLLDGKPLFLHGLETLMACKCIDEVYLDTESEVIIELASEAGAKVLRRDPRLASNATDGNALFMNQVRQVDADIYIQMLCTSPFIEAKTLERAVDVLLKEQCYDSVVLVRKEKQYTWGSQGPNYDISKIPNSVDLPSTTIETMGLYAVRREAALQTRRRIGDRPYQLEANVLEAFDVNYPEDFEAAELIGAGQRERSRKLLANIKTQISSALLSDLLDDLGFPSQVVSGLKPNIDGQKIFGRAKTLRLRKLREGESFKGIYDALKSYDTIVPDDIIVVENEASDYAYFGELNANLAIRSGASGVVVNGVTRDVEGVRQVGLPVFSRGEACQDVRGRATTDSINKTIGLDGVSVSPGDLIFADREGVIVIPSKVEDRVISEVFDRLSNEKNILVDISRGISVDDLIKNYGFF